MLSVFVFKIVLQHPPQKVPKVMHQRYSSHSFRTVHAFFSIMFTTARSNPFTFLA